jgi:DNA-dependent RNA polymerase auxiliary subunit epsilon
MIYKVLYQKDKIVNPRRETTQTLYMEADNMVEARSLVEDNTPYNIELIQELTGNSLIYEKEHADFKLTKFDGEKSESEN